VERQSTHHCAVALKGLAAFGLSAIFLGCAPAVSMSANDAGPRSIGRPVTSRTGHKPNRRTHGWVHGRPILQSRPYTCGPAALATLLRTYLGLRASERQIARLTHTYDDRTTSLAALQETCAAKGLSARACALTLPELITAADSGDVPVLVHLYSPQDHFALFVGSARRGLMLFDPASGNHYMKAEVFLRRWSGAALVVNAPGEQVRRSRHGAQGH
jgi:uncharacterized protein